MDDGDIEDEYFDQASGGFEPFKDPMFMNGTQLNDEMQTIMANIAGSGAVLTIRLEGMSDGTLEVVALDNLTVSGTFIPEPSSLLLLVAGGLGLGLRAWYKAAR